jgi:hypothetical protein
MSRQAAVQALERIAVEAAAAATSASTKAELLAALKCIAEEAAAGARDN